MNILPKSVTELIHELSKLPGIGEKTASRLVFYLLSKTDEDVGRLGETVQKLKAELTNCRSCFNVSESEICPICRDKTRGKSRICVAENPLDVIAIEKSGAFRGLYHVLGGVISPIDGIGPDELRVRELLDRLNYPQRGLDKKSESGKTVSEVILAMGTTMEGEATAMYLAKKIRKKDKDVKITRIARGLPVGGDLEYADEVTLSRALEGRREY